MDFKTLFSNHVRAFSVISDTSLERLITVIAGNGFISMLGHLKKLKAWQKTLKSKSFKINLAQDI